MFALLLLLALFLPGCADTTSADPGVVTVALDQNPDNLDPRIGQNAASQHLATLIFNSLVRKNDKYEIVPDVAMRWEMPDAKTYVFHLRDDVKFHDGRPLTSKDVQYTFLSMLDGTVHTIKAGHPYNLISSIEAPDPYTVIFKLKDVYAPFLWNMAVGVIGIIPDGSGNNFDRHLIGSGPFKLARYVQDQEVVLERNDSYFGKRAGVSRLRFRIIPEQIVVALELRKGSVDIALQVLSPDMVEVLKDDSKLKVIEAEGTIYQYIAFNLTDSVFRDVRVRQAFAYGIDRAQIIKYLWRGQARPAVGLLPPNNWAYNGDVKTYSYDPARARELLREAGHEHLSFTYRADSENEAVRQLALFLQQQLREIGVTMVIQSNEFATFFAEVLKGDFQVYSLRWLGANNDPDMFNYVFHSKSIPPKGANRGHYSNPRVDELIEFARSEVDTEKRRDAYRAIQRIVAEELPYISLFYWDTVCVYSKRIEGIKLYPAADFDFLSDIRIAPDN
ncbi:MAG TPA: ABC transporter substrate-binding protein [Terriglobia bacterium]|nr:ABC transporter substrate-binding protein [Terriglobia bacterium]